MKRSRRIISFLALIMILSTLAVTILSTVSFSSQQVSISLIPNPTIDIVLAKARTATDVTSFEADILNALKNKDINTNNVKVSSVEAQEVNMEESFTWTKDVSSSIGSINITNNGQNVEMKGNSRLPGKNAIWIIPEEGQEQEFNFGYNIDFGDSFNAAGMLLRVKRTENTLEGYMLSFNKSNKNWYSTSGANGAIWKFTYNIGQNSTNMTKTLLQPLNIQTSGTLNVKVTDNSIQISGGGLSSTVTYNLTEPYGNGFGFFSDHYSHDCEKIGSFKLTNINLKTTIVKKFSEVLRLPEWRENSIRVLVNISDYSNDELNEQNSLSELLTRLLNENIHFVSWGNTTNQTQFENLIKANNNKGKFINNTSYTNSIEETAVYIKKLVDEITPHSQYVILGDPITVAVDPPSIMNDTADSNYPYGKWKITHDFEFYENNIGQFAESGKYINNFITTFDKTGRYQILYEDSAVVPENIYVHRKPTAQINLKMEGNSITLTSNSYDLDSYSTGKKGIQEEKWQYKKATDTEWKEGKLTTITGEDDYIVQLRVKDYQDTWSDVASKYITNSVNTPPVAEFSLENETITRYDQLIINDSSYDPAGGTISSRNWEVYKGSTKIYEGTNPPKNYKEQGVGNYSIYLTVKNARGKVSERYGRTFTVIEDTIAPEVVVTPVESDWVEQVTVKVEFTDKGGSKFKQYQYAITENQTTPNSGWSSGIARQTDNIIINNEGEKYLHIKAIDNAGNTSKDRVVGPFKIDKTAPSITYSGELINTQIDYVDIDLQASDSHSGIKSFTLDGEVISNGNHRFTKNGTYKLVATDNTNPSHSTTLNLVIKNIYYNCTAGLDHPIYSSSYDECPICTSYEGLATTENSAIYDGKEHQVKYNNPKNAEIIEYYNETTTKPIKAGNYNYELKVVYENQEYKTNVNGTYTITPKELTITDIIAQDKTYNSDNSIVLSGGRLVGIVDDDEVIFSMPYSGTAESKNVGKWKIAIDEITLSGADASNYKLSQPEYGTITANIYKKLITVKLEGVTKTYDGNKTIELTQPEVTGIIENDDIKINIPKQGEAESEKAGRWNVIIEPITIEGEDAPNYKLAEIKEGDIQVVILVATGELKIGCDDKFYDREKINPYIVEKNSTSEVEYTYYKTGTDEEIERPFDIGIYDVVGHIKTDGNFTEATSDKVTFEIRAPEQPVLSLKTNVIKINDEEINITKEKVPISYQDEITIEMKIENLGKGSGYAQQIITKLPEGFEFLEDNEINKEKGWTKTENGIIETSKLSLQSNIGNEIFPKDESANTNESIEDEKTIKTRDKDENQTAEPKLTKQKVQLVLKVTDSSREEKDFILESQVVQQDKRGDTISYIKDNEEYSKTTEQFELKYIDFEVENRIVEIFEIDLNTGIQTKYDIYQRPKEVVKLDLAPKKVGNSELIVVYQIRITNQGNQKGNVQKITEILPKGVTFSIAENPKWIIDNSGNATYSEEMTEILPNETRQVKLRLRWKVTEDNLAVRTSYAMITAEEELDQKLITSNQIKIAETNNYDNSEVLLSLITGKMIALWISVAIICVVLLIGGVALIKKYVIKRDTK